MYYKNPLRLKEKKLHIIKCDEQVTVPIECNMTFKDFAEQYYGSKEVSFYCEETLISRKTTLFEFSHLKNVALLLRNYLS